MTNEIVLYKPNDQLSLEVKLENETVWLSQQQMVILFDSTKQNISLHINNIFKEGELNKEATVKEYLTVQTEGFGKETVCYHEDGLEPGGGSKRSEINLRSQFATSR